jgi:CheY-like chemotaxis protein
VHILVVEDEFLINLTASENLTRVGHEVVCAYDAGETISLLETDSDIDLMFTDIDLPGAMNGLELAATVRDRWPPVSIIVTSGKHQPSPAELPSSGRFPAKPYRSDELLETIATFQ